MNKLSIEKKEEIQRLSEMKDEDIDYSDIPGITDWSAAIRNKFQMAPAETKLPIHMGVTAKVKS